MAETYKINNESTEKLTRSYSQQDKQQECKVQITDPFKRIATTNDWDLLYALKLSYQTPSPKVQHK
jgi:hypothetical protein